MIWALLRKFPKIILVVGVLAISTALFCFWWLGRSWEKSHAKKQVAAVEDIRPKIALIESKPDKLLLVDNNLYDAESGEIIFSNWLKSGMPLRAYFDRDSKKIIARYERGFVRHNLDGTEDAKILIKPAPLFSGDRKKVWFVKDKDIWSASVDWNSFKLTDEKKLTSIGQFNEVAFAENIALKTEKYLAILNMNQLLRVDLATGEVAPMKIPINDLVKRRSPDSEVVVGMQGNQFYCYKVDSGTTKTIAVGRGLFSDYQWLDSDKCAAIVNAKAVVLYDRKRHTLTEISALPFPCAKITEPSPDGRYVFCVGPKGIVVVDIEGKKIIPLAPTDEVRWIGKDILAYSRETPETAARGTWVQKIESEEKRVTSSPYLVGKTGGWILSLPKNDTLIFATKQGLSKMQPDGTGLVESFITSPPKSAALALEEWK